VSDTVFMGLVACAFFGLAVVLLALVAQSLDRRARRRRVAAAHRPRPFDRERLGL